MGLRWQSGQQEHPTAGEVTLGQGQQGNPGLGRLTAAASSLGGSGSYRGWAHPGDNQLATSCPSPPSWQEGQGSSGRHCPPQHKDPVSQGPSRQVLHAPLLLLDWQGPGGPGKPRVVVLGP